MVCVYMFFGVRILTYDNVLLLKRFWNFQNGDHDGRQVWTTIYYVFSTVYNNSAVWLDDITFLANFRIPIVWGIQKLISANTLLKRNVANFKMAEKWPPNMKKCYILPSKSRTTPKITALCLWICFGGVKILMYDNFPLLRHLKKIKIASTTAVKHKTQTHYVFSTIYEMLRDGITFLAGFTILII